MGNAQHRLHHRPVSAGRKFCHQIYVLTAEEIAAVDDMSEHTTKICKSKIIHMFVEDIEPSLVLADPVEAWHLNINAAATTSGIPQ